MRFYLVSRDGAPVAAYLTESQRAGAMLHVHSSMSTDWAVKYEGYTLTEVDADAWPADAPESYKRPDSMRRTAVNCLTDHGHSWRFDSKDDRILTRENCGACVLSGYGMTAAELRRSGPNYAGWARIYVQAGRAVPASWSGVFWRELAGGPIPYPDGDGYSEPNERYGDALRRDVATFGLRFGTPDGTTVDGSEVRR